ncbi:MAG: carbon starvation protein A, partial [Sphingomonas sp.]
AGWQKMFHADPRIGFLSHARQFSAALAEGRLMAPAKTVAEMRRIILNDCIDAALCAFFIAVVLAILFYGVVNARRALASDRPTTREIGDAVAA